MARLDQLDVFFGELSPSAAQVGTRLPAVDGELKLAGSIYGPMSPISHTLPARIPINAYEVDGWLCGRATIPDPCYWSPQQPMRYDVRVELVSATGDVIECVERRLGLRHLGCERGAIKLEKESWTLRGISPALVPATEFEQWRNAGVVPVVDRIEPWLADAAENSGSILAVRVAGPDVEVQLRSATRCPAVAIGIVPEACWQHAGVRRAAANLLVGGLAPGRSPLDMSLAFEPAGQPLDRADVGDRQARVVIDFLDHASDSLASAVEYGNDLIERHGPVAGFVLLPSATYSAFDQE